MPPSSDGGTCTAIGEDFAATDAKGRPGTYQIDGGGVLLGAAPRGTRGVAVILISREVSPLDPLRLSWWCRTKKL